MRAFLIALAATLLTATATAQRVDLGDGTALTIDPIETIISRPGEDQMATLARAAAVLQAYTQAHGVEACGEVTVNADNLTRIALGTIHAHLACLSKPQETDGFASTHQSIHSHPLKAFVMANAADVAINAHINNVGASGIKQAVHLGDAMHVSNATFSAEDFMTAGWLVAEGHLLYQNGPDPAHPGATPAVHDLGLVGQLPTTAAEAVAQVR